MKTKTIVFLILVILAMMGICGAWAYMKDLSLGKIMAASIIGGSMVLFVGSVCILLGIDKEVF